MTLYLLFYSQIHKCTNVQVHKESKYAAQTKYLTFKSEINIKSSKLQIFIITKLLVLMNFIWFPTQKFTQKSKHDA